MNKIMTLTSILALALACSDTKPSGQDGCTSNDDCSSGEVCIDKECLLICRTDTDCGADRICEAEVCTPGSRAAIPEITSIDGDGTPDGGTTPHGDATDHHIQTRLLIGGTNLAGADVTLQGAGSPLMLTVDSSTDELLTVFVPTTVTEGQYTLTVTNGVGSDQGDVWVVRGEEGAQGPTGATGPAGAAGIAGPQGEAGGGLVLELEFDEAGGPSFDGIYADASPYGNDATTPGGGASGGSSAHTGNGVSLTGGYVQVPAGNTIPDASYVWTEAWINTNNPSTGTRTVLAKTGSWQLTLEDLQPRFTIEAAGGTCSATHGLAVTAGAGTFRHVSGWYNGLVVAVVLDGAEVLASCANGPVASSAGGALLIGDDNASTTFYGVVDEVRVRQTPPSARSRTYGTTEQPGQSCREIKRRRPDAQDGIYALDSDGAGGDPPFSALCDMTRDGGGWTLGIKTRYSTHNVFNITGAAGSVADAHSVYGGYKLADATINEIIDDTFDVLADQVGHNTTYSNGNHEYVILRNYTAAQFRFDTLMPESTTTTVMQSYRAADNALAWTGQLACGAAGGVNASGKGINCYNVVSGTNPAGGGGCDINLSTDNTSTRHHFYMSEHNTDTYLYICNSAQHSSGHTLMHRFWFR